MPDDNPYEEPIPGTTSPTLPMDLQAMFKATGSAEVIKYTPWGNTLTTDLALAAIAGEELGADDVTDLLALSYGSPDELAHELGPRAVELEDMYVRLDQELKRLFAELDTRVGTGKYTVFLTADRGVVDVPQYLKDLKSSAGYIDKKSARKGLNEALAKRFGEGEWVDRSAVAGFLERLSHAGPKDHSGRDPTSNGRPYAVGSKCHCRAVRYGSGT
ncbi:MAG: alkaline phosphatase family protein [Flavobacteriales bacterium]|nr:alkaline phosphatase family protein [Flavobacteriales bacterium]